MRALFVIASLALLLTGSARGAALGELRVLVVRATWGPVVGGGSEERAALAETGSFFERSSYDRLRLSFDLTPWLRAYPSTAICPTAEDEADERRSAFGPISQLGRAAASAAGYAVASYARVVFLLPEPVCGLPGLGVRNEVLLTSPRALGAQSVVHELGHTFGLAHAAARACGLTCTVGEYGDGLSPMGHGFRDFSAYEKQQLGWLAGVVTTRRGGTFRVATVDEPATGPQALVVKTADGDYWIEHRVAPRRSIVVRVVRPERFRAPRTILLANTAVRFASSALTVTRLRVEGGDAIFRVRLSRAPRPR